MPGRNDRSFDAGLAETAAARALPKTSQNFRLPTSRGRAAASTTIAQPVAGRSFGRDRVIGVAARTVAARAASWADPVASTRGANPYLTMKPPVMMSAMSEQPIETRRRRMTIEEYLDFEDAAETKHEYDDGEIVDMSGGSYDSSTIEMNLHGQLSARLRGNPCRPHGTNLKVRITRTRKYRYPDALIVCQPVMFDPDDKRKHSILNPRVVFEILSPSTEKRDRTIKFDDYRSIDGFAEYVLLSQTEPRVESYCRDDDGTWRFDVQVGLDATLRVRSVGIDLPLAELYLDVTFPPAVDEPPVI